MGLRRVSHPQVGEISPVVTDKGQRLTVSWSVLLTLWLSSDRPSRSIRTYLSTGRNQWNAQESFGDREGSISCLSWMPSRFELPMMVVGTSTGRVQVKHAPRIEHASTLCVFACALPRPRDDKPTPSCSKRHHRGIADIAVGASRSTNSRICPLTLVTLRPNPTQIWENRPTLKIWDKVLELPVSLCPPGSISWDLVLEKSRASDGPGGAIDEGDLSGRQCLHPRGI